MGNVLRVFPTTGRLVVEGANMRTRHQRKTPQHPGQILHYEASIHASNAMVVDPKDAKRTRIAMLCGDQGKQRVAKRSGTVMHRGKRIEKRKQQEKEQQPAEENATQKGEHVARVPFWKRAFRTGSKGAPVQQEEAHNRQEEVDRSSVGSVRRSRESS